MEYNSNILSPASIAKSIASGGWKPNIYLTNLSIAQFQSPDDFVYKKLFPIVPVTLATSKYYKFSKADLARDNMQRKPMYGKVAPAFMGQEDDNYDCKVDQIIIGIDQISNLNYERTGAPGVANPARAKVRVLTEQVNLHLDNMFSKNFFKASAWSNVRTGVAASPTANQFIQFDNANSDPVKLFASLIVEIRKNGRRKPNKIGLGMDTYVALTQSPAILDRIKYQGSEANPAAVTENVLAQLFGVKEVAVLASTINTAGINEDAKMEFICDPKGALLCYASDSPAIDEPSAGYSFTWDMLGDGAPIAITQYLGESGTHSEFIEGLCAYDMKKTGDDLAIFLSNCVA